MPSLRDRLQAAIKAFRVGPAVVEAHASSWGMDTSTYNPPEYAEYLATSPSVYSCVTIRATNLAQVPLRLYKNRPRRKTKELVEGGALYQLLQSVNPFWTFEQLTEMTEIDLCLWGEAFWILERGQSGKGQPKEIWRVSPDKMTPVPDANNYLRGFVFEHNGDRIPFTPGEVVWFRYPNPMNEWEGLSPLAAARLSADLGKAGLKSNTKFFDQGMQLAGIITPDDKDVNWPKERVKDFEEMLARRFKGVDKAHKWAILSHSIKAQPMGVSPKDADFIPQMRWSLNDVCRVYGVPPVLVQDLDKATYSNFEQALKALWSLTLVPEGRRLASTLREQLLVHFPGEADEIAFDFSEVEPLQEAEDSKWLREQGQIQTGAITINEWRDEKGKDPVPWGDEPLRPVAAPVVDGQEEDAEDDGTPEGAVRAALAMIQKAKTERKDFPAYGSDEHKTIMAKIDRRAKRHEATFKTMVEDLFERMAEDAVGRLRSGKAYQAGGYLVLGDAGLRLEAKAVNPIDEDEWEEEFKAKALTALPIVVQDSGDGVFDELGINYSFNVQSPQVQEFIKERAQRFAEQVTQTTFSRLKDSLAEGERAGEDIDQLAQRVRQVMGDRIKSDAETIARTEVIGALNGGALDAAIQSEVVDGKTWLAALDNRTRDSHSEAHGQTVGLDEDFTVGGASGPAPGQTGDAAEDINCRCTMTWVLKSGKSVPSPTLTSLARNGHTNGTH